MAYEVEDIFAIGTSAMRDSVNALEVKRAIEKDFDINKVLIGIAE